MFPTGYGEPNARSACAPQTARCTPYRLPLLHDIGPEAERFSGDLALGGKGELLVLHSALLDVVNQSSRAAPGAAERAARHINALGFTVRPYGLL